MGWVDEFDGMYDKAALTATETPTWKARWCLEKNWLADDADHKKGDMEVILGKGNLLMNGGASVMWERLITKNPSTLGPSATTGALAAFSTDNAWIVVSSSNAAAVVTDIFIKATDPTAYSTMASGYPSHTDGTASTTARECQFRAIYTSSAANMAGGWQKWGVMSASSNGAASTKGRLLNSKVQSLGTKTSAATWTFTVTLGLS